MTLYATIAVLFAMIAVMSGAWAVQQRTGNSGWIDAIWTLGTGAVAIIAVASTVSGSGSHQGRTLLVIGLVGLWSLRLGSHILRRSAAGVDDPRYADLMRQWGEQAPRQLFIFLQAQAVAGTVLIVAACAAAFNPAPVWTWLDAVALATAALALAGEAIADAQLRACKRAPQPSGVCEAGLWGWSRHPNYFFEFLFWCVLPLLAMSGGFAHWWQALALLAPAMMYYLLVHVSGIPPLEAHMLRSRGPAYESYQRRVSAFFPRPPRPDTSMPASKSP